MKLSLRKLVLCLHSDEPQWPQWKQKETC
uniref:Uncharacterized protein n=1 Tax=Arundo donax TaxID=35708 RepID=A0A0A9FEM2_ARUDO